jgi:hypothetical protein
MGIAHALTAGNRRGLIATVVAGVLALAGVILIGYVLTHQVHAPEPPLSVVSLPAPTVTVTVTPAVTPTIISAGAGPVASQPAPTKAPSGTENAAPKVRGPILAASAPVSLAIPAINVQTPLMHLGQTAQGSLEVPPPGPDYDKAAWYKFSPTPGELGPAILVGHIDSAAKGPSVFFKLGALRPGDLVRVTRADGSVAVFKVDDVRRFHKQQFPTKLVYSNTDHSALRIITCGGPFDRDAGSYLDNTIVLASLVRGTT